MITFHAVIKELLYKKKIKNKEVRIDSMHQKLDNVAICRKSLMLTLVFLYLHPCILCM